MNNTTEKKDMFYIIVLILTIVTTIIGIAFALYYLVHSQKEGSSAVYTGTLSIEYLSGNIINTNLLYPREKPILETEENVYKNNFRVKNKGSLDSTINVEIETTENEFSNETLMYTLYTTEGTEISEGFIENTKTNLIAENLVLESDETANFTLLIWIKENGKDQNEEMKKTLKGLIKVDANQRIE